jgi:hypothetical protein
VRRLPISLDELHRIIQQDENVEVEFKGEISDEVINGLSTDIAALANTQGGMIIFGVTSKKDPAGCLLDGKERNRISQEASKCRPQAFINFEEVPFGARRFLIVQILNTNVMHSDHKGRFPIRIGAITEYLDGVSLSIIVQDRILSAMKDSQQSSVQNEIKRNPLPEQLAPLYISSLKSDKSQIRIESLKDISRITWRHIILENSELNAELINLLKTGDDKEKEVLLDIARAITSNGTEKERGLLNDWLPHIERIALSMSSEEAARKAFDVLLTGRNQKAVTILVRWILELDQEQYAKLYVSNNLGNVKYFELDIPMRVAMFNLLQSKLDDEKMKRILEVLNAIRSAN